MLTPEVKEEHIPLQSFGQRKPEKDVGNQATKRHRRNKAKPKLNAL